MLDRKRLKEVLITFLDNANNTIDKRDDFLMYWEEKDRGKEFLIPFKTPIWKKSSNLKSFLSHRQSLDKKTRLQFNKENKIPYVLRLHHLLKKDKEYFKDIEETFKYHSINQLGCHNIADRISVKNPKTIKSVRTFFSFPHYDWNKKILQETNGKLMFNKNGKRVIDTNGKIWYSHSINAIKNGNEFSKDFGEDLVEELPFTERDGELKDYSQTTFNLLGNDVLFDVDVEQYQYQSLFFSFNYIKRDEFDFGDFTEEELYEVERWLDYEWLSLTQVHGRMLVQPNSRDFNSNWETHNEVYISLIRELAEEKGVEYLIPLLLLDTQDRIDEIQRYSMRPSKTQTLKILQKNVLELRKKPMELLEIYEVWEEWLERKYNKRDKEFEWIDENIQKEENRWFLPLPPNMNSPREVQENHFKGWIESVLNRIEDYNS
jgi:hypothetical protein